MRRFEGTVAMVSGAGGGIGRAIARKCASRGAAVAVVDIDAERASQTAAAIIAAGGRAKAYAADTTDLSALQTVAEQIEADLGGLEAIFNNAGVFTGGRLERTRPNDFDWVFDVNVRGLYNAVIAFLPALRRAVAAGKPGLIVNTGSENSLGVPTLGPFSAYTGTKHAVLGLTDALRRDLKEDGIDVALLCPGVVQTEIWNAKRVRQERYGGPREAAPPSPGGATDGGRTAEATADTLFEGLDAGEFMIISDPRIRAFAQQRIEEIAQALDICDARVKL